MTIRLTQIAGLELANTRLVEARFFLNEASHLFGIQMSTIWRPANRSLRIDGLRIAGLNRRRGRVDQQTTASGDGFGRLWRNT